MTYKFNERIFQKFSISGRRSDHVRHAVQGEGKCNFDNRCQLQKYIFPSESRQSLVPDRSQQLLHIWVRYELIQSEMNNQNLVFVQMASVLM